MTLSSRRWLYNSFIFVFIITGSFLLFYLQGYRISTTEWQVERTGAIQATTTPDGASIIIDDVTNDHFTPATILSLRPKDYIVELNAAGFQTWKKTLKVIPSEVTFTGEVSLWPTENNGTSLEVKGLIKTYLAPNGENLLYVSKLETSYELWLLNLKSSQSRLLTRNANSEIINVEWSESSREILTQEKNGSSAIWRIFSLETNEWEEISLPPDLNFNMVHWGEGSNLVYAATATELYRIDVHTRNSKIVWREKISDFRVLDEIVFALIRGNNESINLKLLNLSNLQVIPFEDAPTLTISASFLPALNDWLPLFDTDRHSLYLLHSPFSEEKPIRTIPEVTTVGLISDQSIVTTNNFEIWFYDFSNDEPKFVERLSSTLTGALQYGDKPYILFYSGPEVWAVEMDDRGERQRWLLAKYDKNVTGIFVSPDTKNLVVQTIDNLYKINLVKPLDSSLLPIDSPSTMIQKYLHLSNLPEE